jgi:putative flippase GtrA
MRQEARKRLMSLSINSIGQFFKFGVVGLVNTAVSYFVYLALTYLGLYYILASVAAFFISVLCSYALNNKYTFKRGAGEKRNHLHALTKTYISYAFTGLVLSNIILYVCVEILQISKYLAPLCGLLITVPLNYILNKMWAFKPARGG